MGSMHSAVHVVIVSLRKRVPYSDTSTHALPESSVQAIDLCTGCVAHHTSFTYGKKRTPEAAEKAMSLERMRHENEIAEAFVPRHVDRVVGRDLLSVQFL